MTENHWKNSFIWKFLIISFENIRIKIEFLFCYILQNVFRYNNRNYCKTIWLNRLCKRFGHSFAQLRRASSESPTKYFEFSSHLSSQTFVSDGRSRRYSANALTLQTIPIFAGISVCDQWSPEYHCCCESNSLIVWSLFDVLSAEPIRIIAPIVCHNCLSVY